MTDVDIIGDENVGFIIRHAIQVDHINYIVFGEHISLSKWVTWNYNSDTGGYAHGHYFDAVRSGQPHEQQIEALDDFVQRVSTNMCDWCSACEKFPTHISVDDQGRRNCPTCGGCLRRPTHPSPSRDSIEDTIKRVIEISTGHIQKETSKRLNEGGDLHQDLIVLEREFGWFIYVHGYDHLALLDIPEGLQACFDLAAEYDCSWLLLDCDAGKIDKLTLYEW